MSLNWDTKLENIAEILWLMFLLTVINCEANLASKSPLGAVDRGGEEVVFTEDLLLLLLLEDKYFLNVSQDSISSLVQDKHSSHLLPWPHSNSLHI